MRIGFKGRLVDEQEIRVAVIGCGSHSFRNIFPTFQFAPIQLVATCDFIEAQAKAFAEKFGGQRYYTDHKEMLEKEQLDAVFIIVGSDARGRPMYPAVAVDCLQAGCHAWIEKPPAATCSDIELMMEASRTSGKSVMVGYKKMFVQANRKAKELAYSEDFGGISMVTIQNPEIIPSMEELHRFLVEEQNITAVRSFLEHICHPVAQMLSLLGAPKSMMYDRNSIGAGVVVFKFASDIIATINLTAGMALNGGVERTLIISRGGIDSGGREAGRHIVVDNNLKVSYYRNSDYGYGDEPNFYKGTPDQNTAVWEPEFSRGQLFNKGLFLLGYYEEINEFARSILEGRPLKDGTLQQAWYATQIFEKFIEGPGKVIPLKEEPV
jgi:predicted dehydrogenase